ncbi:predicted protein [Uncinocarpus reesii 1704]|uniref:Uncharacterized protein n=1 Tax=Uncinocarpus reesii (strain UAMH 1704) TaxID=336963 RepID=C4JPM6_UNCRE|nr:uncharacterized protein UREG_03198 [Uncinocarpus reesii 1704]EEP78352.1 predicted protein [Uncinocarpus reesii 1704]
MACSYHPSNYGVDHLPDYQIQIHVRRPLPSSFVVWGELDNRHSSAGVRAPVHALALETTKPSPAILSNINHSGHGSLSSSRFGTQRSRYGPNIIEEVMTSLEASGVRRLLATPAEKGKALVSRSLEILKLILSSLGSEFGECRSDVTKLI